MNAILIVSLVMLFAGLRYHDGETVINPGYLSPENTTAIKGIFVMMVFFRHFRQYIDYSILSDKYSGIFKTFNAYTGQLIVVMFLFCSGYGVMEAIKKKGRPYVMNLPAQHGLKTLLHFDIAICLFLILRAVFGKTFSLKRIALSLIGWSSVGNSNWYIFAVIVLYLLTFIAFAFTYRKPWMGAVIITILSILYIIIIREYKDSYWYNTALCYPLGIWYSLLKQKIDTFICRSEIIYWILLTGAVTAFLWFGLRKSTLVFYILWALSFTVCCVLVSMKMSFTNRFNTFLGSHIFSIYILQRIPMIFFSRFINTDYHYVMYFMLCFLSTIVLSLIFDKATDKLDSLIFPKLRFKS